MTYKINKTDGNILAEIPDGTFDTTSSSITLIGKNVTSFGESINENFVKLLENFSSSTAPMYPTKGQLWYDTSTGRLNVYDGSSFRTSSGPLIGSTLPLSPVPGDLWLNNETNQLWFYDGTEWTLAGPIYTAAQGVSGFTVETITDTTNKSHVICLLYVSDTLLGVFSKTEFTPKFPITGYGPPGTKVKIGFNVSVFTSTNSSTATVLNQLDAYVNLDLVTGSAVQLSIIDTSIDMTGISLKPYVSYDNGATWTATLFYEPLSQVDSPEWVMVKQTESQTTVGQSRTIVIGTGATNVKVQVSQWSLGSVIVQLTTSTPSGIKFNVVASVAESLLLEDGVTTRLASDLAILTQENTFTQPLTLQNNFLYFGSSSQVHCRVLNNNLQIEHQIDDKDISLRVKSNAITRDGLTVKGSGKVGIFNSNPQYTLDVGGSVYVSGDLIVAGETTSLSTTTIEVEDKNIVLGVTGSPSNATADGGGITLKGTTDKTITYTDASSSWDVSENLKIAPGKELRIGANTVLTSTSLGSTVVSSSLTSLGALTTLNLNNGLNITGRTISTSTSDLVLSPYGNVNVNSRRITNLAVPVDSSDAVTKAYFESFISSKPLFASLDVTNLTNNSQIAAILDKIAPFFDPNGTVTQQSGVAINGTKMRVHTTKTVVTNSQQAAATLNVSTDSADKNGVYNSLPVVTSVTANAVSPSTTTIQVIRQAKLFVMTNGSWVYDSDLEAPYTT